MEKRKERDLERMKLISWVKKKKGVLVECLYSLIHSANVKNVDLFQRSAVHHKPVFTIKLEISNFFDLIFNEYLQ